jgi:DNA polymerase-3 subunit epsilon
MDDFLEFPLCFLDIETTDNKVSTARITEIAIVKLDKDRQVECTYQAYINPIVPITPEASAVTKLTNEFLKDFSTFSEVAHIILNFIKDCDLAGHNIMAFDIPVLVEEFHRAGFTDFPHHGIKFIDTRALQIKIMPTTLSAVYKFYTGDELDPEKMHGAEPDALASAAVYGHQIEKYGSLLGTSREDLHRISTYDRQIVDFAGKISLNENHKMVYNFGKSQGKLITSDVQYAQWMLDKGDFTMDTKRWIRHALKYDNEFYVSDKQVAKVEEKQAAEPKPEGIPLSLDYNPTITSVDGFNASNLIPQGIVVNEGIPDDLFPPK